MRPLKTNQQVLAWFCVYPKDETIVLREKTLYIAFTVIAWVTILGALASSAEFILKFLSNDPEEALFAVFELLLLITMATSLVILHCFRNKIVNIFSNLSWIYETSNERKRMIHFDKNKNSDVEKIFHSNFFTIFLQFSFYFIDVRKSSYEFLIKTNAKVEWFWKILFKFVMGGYSISIIMISLISVLICVLMNENFDGKHIYRPFRQM